MTKQEWLASEDPAAMLRHLTHERLHDGGVVTIDVPRKPPLASDRKLRLFACACCWGVGAEFGRDADYCMSLPRGPAKDAANWAQGWCGDQKKPTKAERAAILRDIVGNLHRPVTLPLDIATGRTRSTDFFPQGIPVSDCSWLTPAVVALSQAAYEERPGRKCDKCKGSRWLRITRQDYPEYGRHPGKHGIKRPRIPIPCPDCDGTGRIEDGTLNPDTLGILADALEEAGCPAEEEMEEVCPWCRGRGFIDQEYFECVSENDDGLFIIKPPKLTREVSCIVCSQSGKVKTWQPHRLLAHLRSPGPHWRGCWAADLLTGRG